VGCQLYASVGFYFGIGVIFSLGLIILDAYVLVFKLTPLPRPSGQVWIWMAASWHILLIFTLPPLMNMFGRYGLEPAGTACTIDYWHGNIRNYNLFILFVVIFAYLIPVCTMVYLFLRTVSHIQTKEATASWSLHFTEHQAGMVRAAGVLFITQICCWTPYAVVCLWTLVLPPSSLNIYWTLLPSVCCKLAPVLNAVVVWTCIPRLPAAAAYLQRGARGALPIQLVDYVAEMNQPVPESEALTPGSG